MSSDFALRCLRTGCLGQQATEKPGFCRLRHIPFFRINTDEQNQPGEMIQFLCDTLKVDRWEMNVATLSSGSMTRTVLAEDVQYLQAHTLFGA